MRAFARRHSLALYFVVAFTWFWAALALYRLQLAYLWAPALGVFAPTIAAVFVTVATEGKLAVQELVRKLWQWRVAWPWYAAAIGVPIAQGLLALGIAAAFGVFHPAPVNTAVLRTILPWASIVFLLAAAEELGWRGYALPNLLSRYNAIVASLILGTLHALWHWPLILLPHMWLSDVPVVPWTTSIIAQAFVFTWIVRGAGGSVLLAALFHAMGNATTVFYGGVEPRWTPWLKCAVAVLTTVVLLAATRRESWKRARQPNSASATGGRDSQDDLDRNERL